jgi:hypothetical protein
VVRASLLSLLLVLALPLGVGAAEISPDSATYSYGSTSEFSSPQDVVSANSATGSLADTGQGVILASVMALGVIAAGAYAVKKSSSKIIKQ